VTLHSLPVFLRLAGRPVMLIGKGDSADAKRRLLERAGASIVDENDEAALAIVALDAPEETVARLKARGVLVNAVDRPDLCDFTLPAIVDRSPVIVAIGTGGASAGLAAALRQRLEAILPASLGGLAQALQAARARLRERFPKADERRRALGRALSDGAPLDPLCASAAQVEDWLETPVRLERAEGAAPSLEAVRLTLSSLNPDDLTLRQARLLAQADRVVHTSDVPTAILDRARADALRIVSVAPPVDPAEGLTVFVEIAR
jgi:uroporphyrin-III C-methyltransferase/precorrin-2 dehydrogenase/sirohydrochlorin ferrochelatase